MDMMAWPFRARFKLYREYISCQLHPASYMKLKSHGKDSASWLICFVVGSKISSTVGVTTAVGSVVCRTKRGHLAHRLQ